LRRPKSKNDLYQRILESAHNTGMKKNVIGDVKKLSVILCGFNPKKVLKKYDDWKSIFYQIKKQ
jgi:hypothetical protein